MRDRQLYKAILGIESPWDVVDVDLDQAGQRVEVRLEHEGGSALRCPVCGKSGKRHDGRERRWRHLDTCQFQTIIVAVVPRVRCAEHGVKQVGVPWAEPGTGFTALFAHSTHADHSVRRSRSPGPANGIAEIGPTDAAGFAGSTPWSTLRASSA